MCGCGKNKTVATVAPTPLPATMNKIFPLTKLSPTAPPLPNDTHFNKQIQRFREAAMKK